LQVFLLVLFVCVYNLPRFFEHQISCRPAEHSPPPDVNDTNIAVGATPPPSPPIDHQDCRGDLLRNDAYQVGK